LGGCFEPLFLAIRSHGAVDGVDGLHVCCTHTRAGCSAGGFRRVLEVLNFEIAWVEKLPGICSIHTLAPGGFTRRVQLESNTCKIFVRSLGWLYHLTYITWCAFALTADQPVQA
jgi:hypothetical protein